MAAVDEQTLLHDVEQRFLRLSQKLEACEKERDDLRASQGKSDEQISALTLSQSAALRGKPTPEKRSARPRAPASAGAEAAKLRAQAEALKAAETRSAAAADAAERKLRDATKTHAEAVPRYEGDLAAEKRLAVALVDEADAAARDRDAFEETAKKAEASEAALRANLDAEVARLKRGATSATSSTSSASREVEKKAEVFDREVAARKSAVAAYDALAIKHHGALQELEQSKTDAAAALKRAREEKHERSDLERSKRDLALQQRNEQLLRVVRKLAAEAEAKKLEEAEGETSGALEQALKDLEDLKSKREQQETMVRAVVAQRDSYRDQLRARGEVAAIVAAPAAAALTADPAAAALRRAEELALSQETHRVKFKALEADAAAARDEAKAAEARCADAARRATAQAEKDGAERRLADALRSVPPSSAPASSPFVEARAAPAAADADDLEAKLAPPKKEKDAPAEVAAQLKADGLQHDLDAARGDAAQSQAERDGAPPRRRRRRATRRADADRAAQSAATARDAYERELGLTRPTSPRSTRRPPQGAGRGEARGVERTPPPRAQTSDDALATVRVERDALLEQRDAGPGGLGEHAQNAERARAEQASLLRESNASLRADAAKHKAAAEALRAQLDKVHASHVEPKHKLVAQLKAQVATKEQERASHERDASAWRKRVDALLSKVTEKIDADEYRAVEEKLRKAEDQLADATEAAAAAKRELAAAKTKIESLDAAHARDAAAAAQRYLRSLRADGLHRRSLTDAAAAAEKVKARADAADASNVA
ncbi:hypothetical protein JL722_8419 [Aureococcus anophagefferens]|nr:hypothetical protein JL722_8419 [Aureococcus anophagefferens]